MREGTVLGEVRSLGRPGYRASSVRAAAGLLVLIALLGSPAAARSDIIILVTTTADAIANDGACSLREAIVAANSNANYFGCVGAGGGFDLIEFSLGAGTPVIAVGSALPQITGPVEINGAPNRVEIRGGPTYVGLGLVLSGAGASGSSIRNLVVNGFGTNILVSGADDVRIVGNFIGTDASGSAAPVGTFTTAAGIAIQDGSALIGGATGWVPGGSCVGSCNLISGNSNGIAASASSVTVQGNMIGTDRTGTFAIPNELTGINISQSIVDLGGYQSGMGNLVSGNGYGVELADLSGSVSGFIRGNWIGLATNGVSAISNQQSGIAVEFAGAANSLMIGGSTPGERNVISGNLGSGIRISGGGVTIRGNWIGTQADGTTALGNEGYAGIEIHQGIGNTIGGTAPGEANVIAYNDRGVSMSVFSRFNGVRGNSIRDHLGKGIEASDGQTSTTSTPTIASTAPPSGSACPLCAVDVYSDEADEGAIHEGAVLADGTGAWTFAGVVTGPNVTATATTPTGSTSEFSTPVPEPGTFWLVAAVATWFVATVRLRGSWPRRSARESGARPTSGARPRSRASSRP